MYEIPNDDFKSDRLDILGRYVALGGHPEGQVFWLDQAWLEYTSVDIILDIDFYN